MDLLCAILHKAYLDNCSSSVLRTTIKGETLLVVVVVVGAEVLVVYF